MSSAVGCIDVGMLFVLLEGRLHPALAGAVAATAWSLLEPVDRRLFGSDYSDVALLGKLVTAAGSPVRPVLQSTR